MEKKKKNKKREKEINNNFKKSPKKLIRNFKINIRRQKEKEILLVANRIPDDLIIASARCQSAEKKRTSEERKV